MLVPAVVFVFASVVCCVVSLWGAAQHRCPPPSPDPSGVDHNDSPLTAPSFPATQKATVEKSGRWDTSQRSDWMPFRNESLDARPTRVDNSFVAKFPESGELIFDYSTSLRPPIAARTAPVRALRFLIRYAPPPPTLRGTSTCTHTCNTSTRTHA